MLGGLSRELDREVKVFAVDEGVKQVAFCLTSSIFDKAIKSVVCFLVEKKREMAVRLSNSMPPFSKSCSEFLKAQEEKVTSIIWSYLTPNDVGLSSCVSKRCESIANSNFLWSMLHQRVFFSKNEIPLSLGNEEVELSKKICKTRYLETQTLFLDKMGSEFYNEYLGDVKTSPIPEAFVLRAREEDPFDSRYLIQNTHQLVYVPKEITITISAGSNLTLNEEGRLIEDPNVISEEKKILRVPVTLNNLSKLTNKCLKKGHATRVSEESMKVLLMQHGDVPVEAHWSYQRKGSVGLDLSYREEGGQVSLAIDNGYKIPSLIDRVLLNLLTYVRSKAFVDDENVARTSTPVVCDGVSYQASCWAFGPLLGLGNFTVIDNGDVGVSLEVPSGRV